jgi:hypothetical protein
MSKFLSLAVMCSLAFPAIALAQPEGPKQAADDLEQEYGGEEVEPTTETAPSEPAEYKMPEPPKTAADDMGGEYAGEEPEGGERPFVDGLSWQIMASAFYRIGGYTGEGVLAGPYNNIGYPYTGYNGFGLNFAGGLVQYTGEKFGVTVDLRFGTGAPLLTPVAPVKQGYVSWMPSEKVGLDFGFFDTIFGAEVADEWENANYSRGALYFLRQPFNHMGVRSGFDLSDKLGLTLMVTNGGVLGGTPVDGNETPALGWQLAIAGGDDDAIGLYIGGNHAASGDSSNKDWEQFFDIVFTANAGIFTLIYNGDFQISPTGPLNDPTATPPVTGVTGKSFAYGNSLAMIFDLADQWSLGLRGEHLSGNDQYRNFSGDTYGYLATGTLTIRYKPVEYLVVSLEGRGEWTSRASYYSRTAMADATTGDLIANRKNNYAAILGFTAHIGN